MSPTDRIYRQCNSIFRSELMFREFLPAVSAIERAFNEKSRISQKSFLIVILHSKISGDMTLEKSFSWVSAIERG